MLTSLHHLIDREWMLEAYRLTRKDGAPGIDGVTATEYEANLEAKLRDLLARIKSGRYIAPPVRRHYIPKADGTERPLGIPTLEDKVAQRAILLLLEPIYEADFLPCSYGFRPGRSAHDALRALRNGFMEQGLRWVVDVDISKYFDTIDHAHLRGFLDQRVTDGVVRRMIDKWLKAGVLEKGVLRRTTGGTPQGGVISPLLANIYLHYVLDRWFETRGAAATEGAVPTGPLRRRRGDSLRGPLVWQAIAGRAGKAAWSVWAHTPSDQDPLRRLPVQTPRRAASGDGRDDVRLPRLHPRVGHSRRRERTSSAK